MLNQNLLSKEDTTKLSTCRNSILYHAHPMQIAKGVGHKTLWRWWRREEFPTSHHFHTILSVKWAQPFVLQKIRSLTQEISIDWNKMSPIRGLLLFYKKDLWPYQSAQIIGSITVQVYFHAQLLRGWVTLPFWWGTLLITGSWKISGEGFGDNLDISKSRETDRQLPKTVWLGPMWFIWTQIPCKWHFKVNSTPSF